MLFQDPESFLSSVEEIAGLGATALMRYWRTLDPDQVDEKARNDLVSAADLASENAIIDAIRERYPSARFEHDGCATGGRRRLDWSRRWGRRV